jgi:hypothetical protein
MLNPHSPVVDHIVDTALDEPDKQDKRQTAKEIREAVGTSDDVLMRATTVFPFTLFPATVTLDRNQFRVTRRDIFNSAEVFSIRIEDLLSITADVNQFFGTIKLSTRFFDPQKPYTIKFLKRGDTLRLKRITQGYLTARQRKIDCNALSTRELATMLDELGQVAPDDKV